MAIFELRDGLDPARQQPFGLAFAMPLVGRARPILDAEPERDHQRIDPGQLSGAIEAVKLSFRNADGPLVLQGVSFGVEPGAFVAVVGASGSGKSTPLKILLGLVDPLTGGVYYDGKALANLSLAGVRRQIGVVAQAGRLMPGSLHENILAGHAGTLEDASRRRPDPGAGRRPPGRVRLVRRAGPGRGLFSRLVGAQAFERASTVPGDSRSGNPLQGELWLLSRRRSP